MTINTIATNNDEDIVHLKDFLTTSKTTDSRESNGDKVINKRYKNINIEVVNNHTNLLICNQSPEVRPSTKHFIHSHAKNELREAPRGSMQDAHGKRADFIRQQHQRLNTSDNK